MLASSGLQLSFLRKEKKKVWQVSCNQWGMARVQKSDLLRGWDSAAVLLIISFRAHALYNCGSRIEIDAEGEEKRGKEVEVQGPLIEPRVADQKEGHVNGRIGGPLARLKLRGSSTLQLCWYEQNRRRIDQEKRKRSCRQCHAWGTLGDHILPGQWRAAHERILIG